jgi:Uma2 family endonuclease
MGGMGPFPEVVDAPLSTEALRERYRALCDDPRFDNLPGKVELDTWGRVLMSPASTYHGLLQSRLVKRLAEIPGETIVEASVSTSLGVLVADIAWAPGEFITLHRDETPLASAPALCVEVASPSNSLRGLREKMEAYLAAGAAEAWIVFPQSKRIEYYGRSGPLAASAMNVDLAGLFD